MNKTIERVGIVIALLMIYIALIHLNSPINGINIKSNPSESYIERLGVYQWHTLEKEPSNFVWQFAEKEMAYIAEGEVLVTYAESKESVLIKKGDLVTFSPGLRTHWEVKKPLKKYVTFNNNFRDKIVWNAAFKVQAFHRSMLQLLS